MHRTVYLAVGVWRLTYISEYVLDEYLPFLRPFYIDLSKQKFRALVRCEKLQPAILLAHPFVQGASIEPFHMSEPLSLRL